MSTPNFERLKTAYAMMAGIPTRAVNLDRWNRTADGPQNKAHCGSVACLGGWCALYPPFQAEGLNVTWAGEPVYEGLGIGESLTKFFGLTEAQALGYCSGLFTAASITEERRFTRGGRVDHKRIALSRIREFLLRHRQITLARNAELIAYERGL